MSDHPTDTDTRLIRWQARIFRRHDGGINLETHHLSELSELDAIVERGPHWDTIVAIEIDRVGGDATLTVEAAAER